MQDQARLFRVAPSHVYVAIHWTYDGWLATITSCTGAPDLGDTTREVYGPLTAAELLDVLEADVGSLLMP